MQKSFAVKSYTLHLNRSASDPSFAARLNCKNFVPLNALISAPAEAIDPAIHEGKEGEQHAEDLGLMDALRGGARAHLLNELTANDIRAEPRGRCDVNFMSDPVPRPVEVLSTLEQPPAGSETHGTARNTDY